MPAPSRSRSRSTFVRPPFSDARIVDALDAGVVVVRADGHIVRANACAGRILGLALNEIVAHQVGDVIVPLPELIAAARDEEPQRRGELSLERRDGTSTTIGLSISTFRDKVGAVHHVVLFRDISGVLELRRQRDRLLQLAALGDVLPSVLHELRNPLAAVTAMLEVMVEETEGPLQNDLHALLWELRRMTLNLQGIGGISRPVCSTGHTAVDHAIREACRILEPTAQRKHVKITCAVEDLPLLPLDRGVLSGVVFNLVTNSIDACSAGQEIVVRASLTPQGAFLLLVEDNGKGMKPHVLARCCELFFTEKDGGSGIGLALCKEAAASAGGTLDVQSAPGVGTKVTMRVPLNAQRGKKEGGG